MLLRRTHIRVVGLSRTPDSAASPRRLRLIRLMCRRVFGVLPPPFTRRSKALRFRRHHLSARLCYRAPPAGLLKDRPSVVQTLWCPLPDTTFAGQPVLDRAPMTSPPSTWSLRRPAAKHVPRSDRAVSRRLAGLLHQRFAGLLHPAADPGVHRVSALARGSRSRLPLRCSALQSFSPLTKPVLRHRRPRSLLALPPASRSGRGWPSSGPCSV